MTDWESLADKGLGALEHTWTAAKKKAGEGIDKATDEIGGILHKVGKDRWADDVEDLGDSVASHLGASVAEQQLGQTEQADELVHGSAADIRATAAHLKDFRAAFDRVGQGMKGLDADSWKGAAADAFRKAFAVHPTQWLHAADACQKAGDALTRYADTVEWAQKEAVRAVVLHKKALKIHQDAADAYAKAVDTYNATALAGKNPGPVPAKPDNAGAAEAKQAQEILTEARRQRDDAATDAGRALTAALEHAPAKPPPHEQAMALALDAAAAGNTELTHLAGGVVKGTAGVVDFLRGITPYDTYNITHPAAYQQHVSMTLAGLVAAPAHPDRVAGALLDPFRKDFAEGTGRLLPELIGTEGFGGAAKAGTRSGTRVAEEAAESPANKEARAAQQAEPEASARSQDQKKCDGDPVDVATGRMVLPQTDLVIPGSLPLVFSRTFESSYRAGRWFGPTWASTVDQRLVRDAEGLVLVREDGSLLAYPHPEPGAAVLPSHGQRWPLTADADGGYTVTDPESGQVRHFADDGALIQLEDRSGAWIAFGYDESGAPTTLTHSGGHELRLSSSAGRITALSLADGTEVLRYGYTDGHLTSVTNSSGRPLRFGYDELGRITSWTDTNDRHFDYVYDERHRCVAQSGTNGHLNIRFAYGDGVTALTDSLGHTTRYLINDRAQVTAEIDPTGGTTRSAYDAYNRLLTRTDPLGHTTRFTYDEDGRLTHVIRPDGRETWAEYDALGLPVRVTRPDGRTVTTTYDAVGNRTSVTAPDGTTTRFGYDGRNHLSSVTDALGHTTTVVCDRAGRIVSATDPLGATTAYERDAFGRPVALTDPLGRTTRLTWSVEGRLVHRLNPDGTEESWTYDGEGNCLTHTDEIGGVTVCEYGDFDLLTARTGPDGTRHTFTHDTQLRLTGVTNPQGLTWHYTYDPAGRLVSETDFDDRTLTYAYDAAGRLTARTNALGETTTYTHNALGQPVRKDAAGLVTTYAYDAFDALATATSPESTATWLRDAATGRLLTETVNGRTVAYGYDPLGRRTTRTTPSGSTSHWTYDAAGHRTSLTTAGRTLTFERDAAGQELTRALGPSLSLTHEYDVTGRRTAQSVIGEDGRTLQRRGYSYRADGYLTGIDDSVTGPRTFTLDAAARVTAVEAANWSERYAYDEAGNQTSASWPTQHPGADARGARAYTGTRITHAGAVRYEHDALGRVTLRQKTRLSHKPDTWRYEWNTEDRLTAVTTPDGTRWRYTYDPLGRRTSKQRLSESGEIAKETLFSWDDATLCEETTGRVTLTWTHQGLHPVTQTERIDQAEVDDRFFAIVTDLIGTPTHLLAEDGTTAWHTRTTLWGTTTWNRTAAAYTPLRFPGQYYDPESGLHQNVFRAYDPETARYLTSDPLGLKPDPNPATYIHNPHTWSDPLGLTACPPKGEKSNPFKLRGDAERAAFEAAGVPFGTTPDAEWVVMGDRTLRNMPGHVYSSDPTHWGNFRQFETPNGSRVVVEHTHDPAGPHFHAGGPKGSSLEDQARSGVNFGWDNSAEGYETMERYRAIDKPGGDHHFFYEGN
ncbi:putative T7SS-secreted protein [Streptomyces racemochromogenes]|uniref:T7SS-secreted protein n=1 Tax=Streptomyces racemochromogenes TaxID=67353 RepID=A0ABW7PN02_9ACTN